MANEVKNNCWLSQKKDKNLVYICICIAIAHCCSLQSKRSWFSRKLQFIVFSFTIEYSKLFVVPNKMYVSIILLNASNSTFDRLWLLYSCLGLLIVTHEKTGAVRLYSWLAVERIYCRKSEQELENFSVAITTNKKFSLLFCLSFTCTPNRVVLLGRYS
jgi:hypothetical protein